MPLARSVNKLWMQRRRRGGGPQLTAASTHWTAIFSSGHTRREQSPSPPGTHRTPLEMPSSVSSAKARALPVLSRCVPPQNSMGNARLPSVAREGEGRDQ